ncbi:MAG: TAT-variant-translocated molybdopterin oxidoreductase [Bacteroidetes bacterium]|jgi:molybdopterin-containing oxidoreductase family iron-sulfur binding subunit|nr:TAT-variant-translocated molybdopterin oxidoreductase [Bacteroidota bacterium]
MKQKKYWTSEADLNLDPAEKKQQQKEFAVDPIEEMLQENGRSSRRDFLKVMGFSIGASAVLAACSKSPVKYALPYTNKPAEVTPGVPNYYASTFFDGSEYSSVLVKVREGRPIFIEGNPDSSITQGSLGARGNAAVLDLYDGHRIQRPQTVTGAAGWDEADKLLKERFKDLSKQEAGVRLVTGSILSPSTLQLIAEFGSKQGNFKHISYDADSASGIILAHERHYGQRMLPRFRFDKAEMIVGINADFLGTWISPIEFTRQYVQHRTPSKDNVKMSRHVQIESTMTLTGANADQRLPIKPSMEGAHVLALHDALAALAGRTAYGGGQQLPGKYEEKLAAELWAQRAKALVVCGSNDAAVQQLVIAINQMLGSYGTTIDASSPSYLRQGVDTDFQALIQEMEQGKVGAVLFYDCNPAYTYAFPAQFASALKKVKTRVALTASENETSALCTYKLPTPHWLESWGDAQPYKGYYSLQQPTIPRLYDSRSFQDVLLTWMDSDKDYLAYLQNFWKSQLFYGQAEGLSADQFWVKSLEKGVFEQPNEKPATLTAVDADLAPVAAQVAADYAGKKGSLDVYLYRKIGIGAGVLANVPWLQELPDPITKATWDNYVAVSPKMASDKGLKTGDIVKLEVGRLAVKLPVLVQPGVQPETVAVAVGYGRTVVGKGGYKIGQNVWPATTLKAGQALSYATGAKLSATGDFEELALAQTSLTAMDRPIIHETTLSHFTEYTTELQHERSILKEHLVNLYPLHERGGHRWAMAIDLNKCTGCGSCVVACQAENNIPVVGKDEVRRRRELHWMRIDRYYSIKDENADFKDKEIPADQPDVVFQPMLCQHCDNAPCENVCPVLATVHSSEGLNQQAYNRCFGTRYCANNCPYKVRRFNWLDYTDPEKFTYNPVDNLGRMVLNPDVTVRARGVMEKCSFCAQRLQAGKLAAKMEQRKLTDADVQPACAKTCPAGAIVFGDLNDKESTISKYYEDERTYFALEEIKVLPSVAYKVVVRNRKEEETAKA